MDEDTLIKMYQDAWDPFLEAYKTRLEQNGALVALVVELIETIESERPNGTTAKPERAKLEKILEEL